MSELGHVATALFLFNIGAATMFLIVVADIVERIEKLEEKP
jgi:hypothetical protein